MCIAIVSLIFVLFFFLCIKYRYTCARLLRFTNPFIVCRFSCSGTSLPFGSRNIAVHRIHFAFYFLQVLTLHFHFMYVYVYSLQQSCSLINPARKWQLFLDKCITIG
ncbi:hypothetical protein PUN28_003928 [Cardiocondyla obscurior]|uniref:Secreted protein n=1 Tax=Cardiocondyla obscurior TaxID=286306 RepID=A0AAW2GNF4_9HYME